jgi:group I intron endonuclease
VEKISGIYCIENLVNGKRYVGQSDNIYRRFKDHLNQLKGNRHKTIDLQNDWNIFGEQNWNFWIVEKCENDQNLRYDMEIYYINELKSHISQNGYNTSWGGSATFKGMIHTEKAKETIRQSRLGTKQSEESNRKNSESNMGEKNGFYGKNHSEETKQKMKDNHADVSGENNPSYGKTFNQGRKSKNSTSKYSGVSKRKNKWSVRVQYQGKQMNLGSYETEEEAALVYNEAVLKIYGKNAILNIISNEEKGDE